MRMYCAIAESLKDDGHYVAGVEHDDLLRRMFGLPIARRYTPGGVFIEHFDIDTLRREISPYFSRLQFQFIRAKVPFARRVPVKLAIFLSLVAVRLPVLKQLAEILLVRAECPIRPPKKVQDDPETPRHKVPFGGSSAGRGKRILGRRRSCLKQCALYVNKSCPMHAPARRHARPDPSRL